MPLNAEDFDRRGNYLAEWTLRVAVGLQCLGLWRIALVDGTSIGTTLFVTWEWAEYPMLLVDRGVAWLCLALGVLLMARIDRDLMRRVAEFGCGVITLWFLTVAALMWFQGGKFGYEYSVAAHATRIFAPLALLLLLALGRQKGRVEPILRFAAATTFAIHGVEALEHNPVFVDYIITAARRVDIYVSQPFAEELLTAIGVQDLVLAALVATKRWRAVAAYMAFWGFITAASRVVHLGIPKWPATLVRAANWGVPLALYFMWRPREAEVPEVS